ncbi:MAG: winged helix-turn-helix transcriptional regulator [Oceanospirillaceae bacterium]|nr:winged helix-turn-helix transcriptional regulator [Oceanospirillaceae bacterium]
MKTQLPLQTLERLASLLRSERRNQLLEHGLLPIQLEVLQYLSICNHYSDTPMGVTDYLNQTKGSVSQTLKVLEKKGLIEKIADSKDKRVAHLKVTIAGQELVGSLLASPLLTQAHENLDAVQSANINSALNNLLRAVQSVHQFKSFGQCYSCINHTKLKNGYFCELTKEPLTKNDIELICREHQPLEITQ